MKSYSVIGWIESCEVYCADCAEEGQFPIFADSEWDYQPSCTECGYEIPVYILKPGEWARDQKAKPASITEAS